MRALGFTSYELNSLGSMPALRSMHSSGSALPVTSAIWGMSAWSYWPSSALYPSYLLRGRRSVHMVGSAAVQLPVTELAAQAVTCESRSSRRHLPIWTTMGMFVPDGAFVSVN